MTPIHLSYETSTWIIFHKISTLYICSCAASDNCHVNGNEVLKSLEKQANNVGEKALPLNKQYVPAIKAAKVAANSGGDEAECAPSSKKARTDEGDDDEPKAWRYAEHRNAFLKTKTNEGYSWVEAKNLWDESSCFERCFCCRTSSSQVSTQRVTVEPMVYKNPWEGEPIRFLCLIFSSWRWTGGCPRTWWKNDPRITCGCFRDHSQCPHIIPKNKLSTCCHYYASFFGRIQLPLVHPGSKARALKPIGSIYSPGW